MSNRLNLGHIIPVKKTITLDESLAYATGTITVSGQPTAADTLTIGSVLYTFVSALAAYATAVLTSDEVQVDNADAVEVGAKTYTFKTALSEAFASAVLTSDTTNPADAETVTINDQVYTFKTALTTDPATVPNEILIGVDTNATLANLIAAVNGTAGEGTTYSTGTVQPTDVTAGSVVANAVTFTADTLGTGPNSYAKAEDSTHLDWDGAGATFTGGVNAVVNEVLIGSDADDSLLNLKKAVNGEAGEGTKYSTGTVASTEVSAGAVTAHAITFTAITIGAGGNSLAKSETSAHLDYDGAGATFTGGHTMTANDILIGASAAATLDNVKSAINATAGAGTTYGTGTVANPDATATTNADTTQIIQAATSGFDGNSVVFEESMANTTIDGSGFLAGGGASELTETIGGEGGMCSAIIVNAPQFAGTITLTLQLLDVDGDILYESTAINENAVTRILVEHLLMGTDVIKITASGEVEETIAIEVSIR